MRRGIIIKSCIVGFVLFALLMILSVFRPSNDIHIQFMKEITVENGKANPKTIYMDCPIEKDGKYIFHISWDTSDPNFITACTIRNSNRDVVAFFASDVGNTTLKSTYLVAGRYTIEFNQVTTPEEYGELRRLMNVPQSEAIRGFAFRDGVRNINYQVHVDETNKFLITYLFALASLILVMVVIVLMLISNKDYSFEKK